MAKVEVSTDGGKRWSEARLLDRAVPFAWRFWEYDWAVPAVAGHWTVLARATDEKVRVQPWKGDEDRRDAMISHVQPIQVRPCP